MIASYPVRCPLCDHVADSMDSLADSRAELADHLERRHPDQEPPPTCVHCGAPVRPAGDDWIHSSGLYRCQSPNVAYGHLAHPADVPCRADGPNPCLGAAGAAGAGR